MRFELCGLVKLRRGGVEFRRHNTAILPRNRAPNTYKTYSSLPKKVRLMPKKVRLMPKRLENVNFCAD
jgi:hypothetical protein